MQKSLGADPAALSNCKLGDTLRRIPNYRQGAAPSQFDHACRNRRDMLPHLQSWPSSVHDIGISELNFF